MRRSDDNGCVLMLVNITPKWKVSFSIAGQTFNHRDVEEQKSEFIQVLPSSSRLCPRFLQAENHSA